MSNQQSELSQIQAPDWLQNMPTEPNICAVCGHDKHYFLSLTKQEWLPMVSCRHCKTLAEQARQAAEREAFRNNISDVIIQCGAPEKFRNLVIETFSSDIIEKTASVMSGRSTVIYGKIGRGKTTLAIDIMRQLLLAERYFPEAVRFTTVEDLCRHIREGIGKAEEGHDDRIYIAAEKPLLILDRMGAERPTDNNTSIMQQIITARYEQRRQTIITTRLTSAELSDRYGEELGGMLKAMLVIHLVGEDKRLGEVW
jgi:DNA replication protein DnaC